MKIRNGFVSNSSSSSFVIRGIELDKVYVAGLIGVKPDECDFSDMNNLYEAIYNKLDRNFKLSFEDTKDYFNDEPTETMIIGVEFEQLEDGCVCKLSNTDDEEIKSKLKRALGIEIDQSLHTFIQYIGNDNY